MNKNMNKNINKILYYIFYTFRIKTPFISLELNTNKLVFDQSISQSVNLSISQSVKR